MRFDRIKRRAALTLASLGLAGTLGACDSLLDVSNPGAIGESTVEDPSMAKDLVNSVVAEFQRMYTDLAYYGAILTDEAVTGHNFFQIQEFDLRIVEEKNSQLPNIYNPVQRARGLGEDMVTKLRGHLGANAASDLGFAKALAYTGYASVMLGEYFCSAPVHPEQPAITSDSILRRALPYFDEAIAVATAAKAAGASAASADAVINFARVGGGRAALNLGDNALAIQYASAVPADFVAWSYHSDSKTFLENIFLGATTGNNHNLGVDAAFRGLNDPRVRHWATGRTGHNGTTVLFTPYQSSSFSGWNDSTDVAFAKNTNTRIASGLEARYIVAEAEGPTLANVDFVNTRRAVAGMLPLLPTVTEAEYRAALRDQRRRDFFLDGHRLGDLRRYKKLYNVDQFPSGQHPNESWGPYGTAECFIPTLAERISNPAY